MAKAPVEKYAHLVRIEHELNRMWAEQIRTNQLLADLNQNMRRLAEALAKEPDARLP